MPSPRSTGILAAVVLFAVTLAVCLALFQPFASAAVGFDSASSVLYFQRLVAGQRIEALPFTTPKPLITLVFGALFQVGHDWRLIAWASDIEYGVMVVAAAALAWRTAGPAAAGFAATAAVGLSLMLLDAATTYATPWAALGWIAAGLALTAARPRYGLAGVALMLAALCRIETLIVVSLAAAILGGRWLLSAAGQRSWPRLGPRRGPERREALVLVGFAALPVMAMHDWMLTGDPFFWLQLSRLVSPPNLTVAQLPAFLAAHYGVMAPLLAVALLGVAALMRRRQWVILSGLLALGPGQLAFLFFLAATGTDVSYRYLLPADAAVAFAAAVGAGAALDGAGALLASRADRGFPATAVARAGRVARAARVARAVAGRPVVVAVSAGAVCAVVLVRPFGPFDPATRASIDALRATDARLEAAIPTLRSALATLPDPPRQPTGPPDWRRTPPARIWTSLQLWPRTVVDLGVPLWAVAPLSPLPADRASFRVARTGLVLVETYAVTAAPGSWWPLAVSRTTRIGSVIVEPIVARPGDGFWIERLVPAGP